ncbi:DUF2231 domain-containing protein [Zunongwangia sp. H14]|uniref:DUF2231 domain-containing protein n=1 Tax=Zunongwangia sp. H14 TaxID=3240792 RepID=UPI0035648F13
MKSNRILCSLLLLFSFSSVNTAIAVNKSIAPSTKAGIKAEIAVNSNLPASPAPVQDEDVAADFNEFPNLHPLVVHFPVVLLIFAAVLQLLQLFRLNRTLDWVILLLIGSGFIAAYIAANFVHPHTEGLTETAKKVLEHHDTYATWVLWSSATGAVLKLVSLFGLKQNRKFEIGVSLVILLSAYAVSQAGHYGSQLVYIEGVGPQVDFLGNEDQGGHQANEGHSH